MKRGSAVKGRKVDPFAEQAQARFDEHKFNIYTDLRAKLIAISTAISKVDNLHLDAREAQPYTKLLIAEKNATTREISRIGIATATIEADRVREEAAAIHLANAERQFNEQHFERQGDPVARRAAMQAAIDGVARLGLHADVATRYTQLLTTARDAVDAEVVRLQQAEEAERVRQAEIRQRADEAAARQRQETADREQREATQRRLAAEREQIAAAERDRVAREQAAAAERDRIARETAARERAAAAERDRIAREQAAAAERERIARETAARERAAAVERERVRAQSVAAVGGPAVPPPQPKDKRAAKREALAKVGW
jgi:hypothetical protein